MNTYGGVEVQLRVFLTSALDGGEWSASRPRRFTPGKKAPVSIAWRLGGPQNGSGHGGDPCPYRESNRGRPARIRTILRAIPTSA
jgi:hypothetical protein